MEELFAEVGKSWKEQQGMLNNSGTRKMGSHCYPQELKKQYYQNLVKHQQEQLTGATTVPETDSPQPGRKGAGWQ